MKKAFAAFAKAFFYEGMLFPISIFEEGVYRNR